MSSPLYIFGTGGHARDVAEVVWAIGREPVLITQAPNVPAREGSRATIISEVDALAQADGEFAIGIGDGAKRERLSRRYGHLRFPALVHPDVSLACGQRQIIDATRGTILFAGVRMMGGVKVGSFCALNLNATLSHDCEIGDFATLAPGANVAGNVRVGRGAWIGMGSVVNQGTDARKLDIGANTIIGSGCVVLDDCAADSVYVGNPARKIR